LLLQKIDYAHTLMLSTWSIDFQKSHTVCMIAGHTVTHPLRKCLYCSCPAGHNATSLDLQPIVLLLQAKVEVCTEVPIKFHARSVAYLLTSDQVFKLQQWDPAAHVLTEDIVGSVTAATIMCNDKDVGEVDGLYSFKGSSVLTFRGETLWIDLSVVLFHCAV